MLFTIRREVGDVVPAPKSLFDAITVVGIRLDFPQLHLYLP